MKRVWSYIKRYKLHLFFTLILALVIVALTLYVPILIGRAIDFIVGAGNVDFQSIFYILLEVGVLVVLTSLFQWIMNTINNKITFNIIRDVREDAFRKIQVLPFKYLDRHESGEIVSKVITDVDQFADGLLMGFTQVFTGLATIIGTLGFMFAIDVKITLIVVVLTPLSLLVARFIANRTYEMFRAQSEIRAEQTALIDEMLGNQKVVKAFGHGEEVMTSFDDTNQRLEKCSLRAIFYSSITNPGTRFVNGVVYAAVALAGAFAAVAGGITVGGLSCLLSYANQYTKPFNEISGVITELQNALACAARVFDLIDEIPEPPCAPNGIELEKVKGSVSLKNVHFSYVPTKKLIEGFNLEVQPGQNVAIVGPTGSGKTTLINLLMRFYDVNEGEIKIDGINIKELTRESLRGSFGMVLQETWLKEGTIKENIRLGKPDATDEEIINAAKASHSHSFIKRLPNGYDTYISENDGMLSHGEKQLLCITRVMLSAPPMLILDEATSSIDSRTEIKIQKAFKNLMSNRTSFIVAHRLSTIREADVILVMKDGNIIEQGTHEELLSQRGFYYELNLTSQTGEEKEDKDV